jgi:hypothetical protein
VKLLKERHKISDFTVVLKLKLAIYLDVGNFGTCYYSCVNLSILNKEKQLILFAL